MLENIHSPRDLDKLSYDQLDQLAREIREVMVTTVSENGGHLASNLGVVELTLALHRVFHMPEDKIVFDVGHQSYVHKLITGRYEQFSTLRSYGGISGFPKRCESEYDCFETGHASTAISAALGLARARDFRKEKYQVLAVVGDGLQIPGAFCRDIILLRDPAVADGLLEGLAGALADDDLDAVVLEVERLSGALDTITDDGDDLVLEDLARLFNAKLIAGDYVLDHAAEIHLCHTLVFYWFLCFKYSSRIPCSAELVTWSGK